MTPRDQRALDLYQQHIRTDGPAVADALLSDFFAPADYIAQLDVVRNAMSEEVTMSSEGYENFDIGLLTSGIRMNAADVCEAFWKNPDRRSEFGEREIRDIRESVLGLWTLLREIEKAEAA